MSKSEKADLKGAVRPEYAPFDSLRSFGALCLCKVLAPTLPKVTAVPSGTLVIRVLREDRLNCVGEFPESAVMQPLLR